MRSKIPFLSLGFYVWVGVTSSDAHAQPLEVVDITAGWQHSCLVTSCGDVHCWGNNSHGQADSRAYSAARFVPFGEGPYTAVSAGERHTCALRDTGEARCWGDNARNQLVVPRRSVFEPYRFQQIDAGAYHTCGVTDRYGLVCWGDNQEGQTAVPLGAYKHVSAGRLHACAVSRDGTQIRCWGANPYGQTAGGTVSAAAALPFGQTFATVSAGGHHTCATTNEALGFSVGRLVCWGNDTYGQVDGRPSPFVRGGSLLASPLDPNNFERATLAGGQAGRRTRSLGYPQVAAGDWATCVSYVDATGTRAVCMGWEMGPGQRFVPPVSTATRVAFGRAHGCLIDDQGRARCWGPSSYGLDAAPSLPAQCPAPTGLPSPLGGL